MSTSASPRPSRRTVLYGGIAAGLAVPAVSALGDQAVAAPAAGSSSSGSTGIRPFHFTASRDQLNELRRRVAATRWPSAELVADRSQGVQLATSQALAKYWNTRYDWRRFEAKLNKLPQYTTEIDGVDIHFIHVRSRHADAMPLIMTHGWPGSIVEFLNVIGPLTDPRAHGGDPADAFHLVIPSIPGSGFSGPTREAGWDTNRVTRAFAELMNRLGYDRYGAQGGDTGAVISPGLGRLNPDKVVGVHANGLSAFTEVNADEVAELTEAERTRLERLEYLRTEQSGYVMIQISRPQTLAHGLHDSPVGQLAWIVEKFKEWTDPAAELPEDAVDRDLLLTNVMLYWLTGTAGSSANSYYEAAHAGAWGASERSTVPTGAAVFPLDVSIRRTIELEHTIVHWSEFGRGGHFAAMEAPDLLVDDVRDFFSKLR